jgi:hypothetical protein
MTDAVAKDQREGRDDAVQRRDANRAVGLSAAGLALTGLAELLLAVVTGSVALLGDAIHNLSDVSTSAVVFLGFRVSKRPASRSHPYGYERAEDLAGLGVAIVIWVSAVFAGYESYRKLTGHGTTTEVWLGMAGAAAGIAGNQAVAWYKRRVGKRIGSLTLIADARHSWLDAISSLRRARRPRPGRGRVPVGRPSRRIRHHPVHLPRRLRGHHEHARPADGRRRSRRPGRRPGRRRGSAGDTVSHRAGTLDGPDAAAGSGSPPRRIDAAG